MSSFWKYLEYLIFGISLKSKKRKKQQFFLEISVFICKKFHTKKEQKENQNISTMLPSQLPTEIV